MALSGSKSVKVTDYDTLKFSWTATQSISGNYSLVDWKLQLISGQYGAIYASAKADYSVIIGNYSKKGTNTVGISANTTKTLATGTTQISHNSDGKKTFTVSFSQEFNITFDGKWIGTIKGSSTFTLNTIPRAETMSVPSSFTIGSDKTITVNRISSLSHTITVTFGSASSTITTKGTASSYSFTPPMSWCNQVPSKTSGTATFKIQTYSGSTLIGTKTYSSTMNVPSSVKPTVTYTHSEAVSGMATKFGAYVKTKSKVKFTLTGKGAYGSTIESYSTKFNGQTLTGSSPTSDYLNYWDELIVTVTVTDSRGRTGTATGKISVLNYTAPSIKAFSVFRSNSSGTQDEDGTNAKILKNFTIDSINNKNDNSWKIEYKKPNETSWKTLFNGTGYSVNNSHITGAIFGVDDSFELRLTLSDYFNTVTRTISIPTAFTLMDFHKSGKGISFGKVATLSNGAQFGMEVYDKYDTQFRNGLAYYPSGGADANDTIEEIALCSKNIPYSDFAYVRTMFYGSKTLTANRTQIAYPYTSGRIATRRFYNGSWSEWQQYDYYQEKTAWKNLTNATNWNVSASGHHSIYRQVGNQVEIRFHLVAKINLSSNAKALLMFYGIPSKLLPVQEKVRFCAYAQNARIVKCAIDVRDGADAGTCKFQTETTINAGEFIEGSVVYLIE